MCKTSLFEDNERKAFVYITKSSLSSHASLVIKNFSSPLLIIHKVAACKIHTVQLALSHPRQQTFIKKSSCSINSLALLLYSLQCNTGAHFFVESPHFFATGSLLLRAFFNCISLFCFSIRSFFLEKFATFNASSSSSDAINWLHHIVRTQRDICGALAHSMNICDISFMLALTLFLSRGLAGD